MAVELNYRVDGIGKRIVLLHPVGLDLTFFDLLTADLSSRFKVLRVDLRGHGGSAAIDEGEPRPQLKDFADDVHFLLQSLDYRPAAVIGFSFGGMIAQELALQHPEDVSALVASACGSTFTEETRKTLRERGASAERGGMASIVQSTIERWFTEEFRAKGGDQAARERLLRNDLRNWKQTWRAIAELDTLPHLHTIQAPTLCLAGENDVSTPPAVVRSLADAIPHARFDVVPGSPHMLFIEQHGAVAAAIREFLDTVLA